MSLRRFAFWGAVGGLLVCSLIPNSRLTIATVLPFARPTSASLNAVMICSGVCRLLLILTSSLIAATKAAS